MIKVELKKSNSGDVVSGSLDIRISPPTEARGASSSAADIQLVNQLGPVSLNSSASAVTATRNSNTPVASSSSAVPPVSVTEAVRTKSGNAPSGPSASSASGGAMSSVEDQFGPLPAG
jgi:hypothetical protein